MQGEIYHTIKASQMCAPFQRDRRKMKEEWSRGAWSSRGMREEGGMKGLMLWGSRQEQGTGAVLRHILGTCEKFPVYWEHYTWENSPSIKVKEPRGKISLMLFFLLLHIKPWWILKGCFLSWIIYLQNKDPVWKNVQRPNHCRFCLDFLRLT